MPAPPPRGPVSSPRSVALAAAGLLVVAAATTAPGAAASESEYDPVTAFDGAAQAYLAQEYDLTHAEAGAALAEQEESLEVAEDLEEELGSRLVRTIVDERTGELTAEVTDPAAARAAEAAGAVALVDDEADDLTDAQESVEERIADLGVTGVSVSLAPGGDSLVLSVPDESSDGSIAELLAEVEDLDADVEVEEVEGEARTLSLYGGEDIRNGTSRCSAGFNLVGGGTHYVLTAGHCAGGGWTDDGLAIGTTTESRFPGDDFALIRIDDPVAVDPIGEVLFGAGRYDVSSVGSPSVGATVCRTGGATGTWCDKIEAYGATVSYTQGTVSGLLRVGVCAESGDSGGPLYAAGGVAVGVLSGAIGDCTAGGTTYYQPVSDVTSEFGLSVL